MKDQKEEGWRRKEKEGEGGRRMETVKNHGIEVRRKEKEREKEEGLIRTSWEENEVDKKEKLEWRNKEKERKERRFYPISIVNLL